MPDPPRVEPGAEERVTLWRLVPDGPWHLLHPNRRFLRLPTQGGYEKVEAAFPAHLLDDLRAENERLREGVQEEAAALLAEQFGVSAEGSLLDLACRALEERGVLKLSERGLRAERDRLREQAPEVEAVAREMREFSADNYGDPPVPGPRSWAPLKAWADRLDAARKGERAE